MSGMYKIYLAGKYSVIQKRTEVSMKTLVTVSAALLAAALFLSILPLGGEEQIFTDTIRLHVIASSDDFDDQARKLLVRDAVSPLLETAVENADTVTDAAEAIGSLQDEIRAAAEEALSAAGCDDDVSVLWSRESYPVRAYDGVTLPGGTYQSLRVVIGEGAGQNFWCILFPNISFRAAAVDPAEIFREEGFSDDAVSTVVSSRPTVRVKWKVLEIFSRLFS